MTRVRTREKGLGTSCWTAPGSHCHGSSWVGISDECSTLGGTGGLMVNTRASRPGVASSSPTSVRAFFFSSDLGITPLPWSPLSSIPVFHRILRRGCKAVGPGGPGSIGPWLFQALVSHHNGGKPYYINKAFYLSHLKLCLSKNFISCNN